MDAKLVVAVDSTQVKKADDDLNKLAATAAKVESEISDLGAAGAAAAKGMSAMGGAAGGSVQQLTQAERIMQRAGLTAGQYSQAMGLLPAQLTDVVTSLASGMPVWLVAIQQGGQIKDSFNGIGNAARAVASAVPPVALGLTAVGAAAVTAAVGLAKGEAETAAFNRAIILTGNAAGTTADQLRGMAIALGGSATEGAAAAALAEIAATGKIAADQIQAVATAALSMEQTTGKAVSDTVKEFVRLADEPAAASAKLNEQYNYLTTSVYEQIKALEDQGRTTEAAKLATDTYAEAIRERSGQVIENLGYVESAWNAIVGVTKRATDAIREFGRDQTISDQIADIDAKLTDAYSNMATAYSDADKAATQGYINRLNAQKTALQLSQNEANLQAGIDSLRAERTKQEIADAQARDRALSGITNSLDAQLQSAQRLTVEERTRQQLTKAGVDLDSEAAKAQLEKARQVDAASAAAKAATEAEREGEKAKRAAAAADKKRAEEIQRVLDTLLPMEAAERKHAEQLAVLDSLVRSGDLSWQEYQVAVQNAWATLNKVEFDKAAQEMRKGEQEAKRLAAELQSIEDRLDPLGAAARKYQQEQAKLNAAIAKGGPEADKYRATLTKLEAEYAENQRAATAWGKWTESALERVDSAFADAWMNIGEGFKGFRDSLTNAFKQMLAELAHMAITKPIVLSLGAALGIGGSSQALASGGSGILGGGGGGFGLNEAWNAVTGAYSAATSGFGQAVLGGWQAGQGILGGLSGAASAGWNYGANALSGLGAGFGGLFGGGAAAAAGAPAAGFGLGQSLVQGGLGNAVYAAPAGILGSGLSAGALGISGIGGALYGYQQAGWKGAATGGLGAAGGALLGNILLPGLGGIIGGALGGMLGGSLFGGDWITKHSGIAVGAKQGEFQGFNYEYMEKKGGLFGSDKSKYKYTQMDATLEAQLSKQFDSVVETVPKLFEKLGFDVAEGALDGLNVGMRHIALSGSPEKQQEQIEKGLAKWFSKVGNVATADLGQALVSGFAADITETTAKALDEALQQAGLNLSEKQLKQLDGLSGDKLVKKLSAMKVDGAKVGEATAKAVGKTVDDARAAALETLTTLDAGLAESLRGKKGKQLDKEIAKLTGFGKNSYETLSELVGKLDSVNSTFETLNLALYDNSLAGAKAAENMVALAGGLEEFAKKTSFYYDKFFSETEKAEDTVEAAVKAFADLNIVIPGTREGFRDLVESLDTSTESGRALFNTLMDLAGSADAAYGSLDFLRKSLADEYAAVVSQVSSMLSAAQQAVLNAYQREASVLQNTIAQWTQAGQALASYGKTLSSVMLQAAEPAAQLARLRAEFASTASKAALGDMDAIGALPSAGNELISAALAYSSSREDYLREVATVRAAAAAAEATAGRQKSIAEKQLEALDAQLKELKLASEALPTFQEAVTKLLELQVETEKQLSEAEQAALKGEIDWLAKQIVSGLDAQDFSKVLNVLSLGFSTLDTSLDGLLSFDELKAALDGKASDAQIENLISQIDKDGDGLISAIEIASGNEVSAVKAVEAAIRAQAAQVGGGVTENLADAGKDITLAEFTKAVQTAAAGKGISATVANDKFVSSLFNQMDTNRNGKIRQGGANNEYSQLVVENAIAELLKAQQTPTTPGSPTPTAKYTYDKARVDDSLEAAIDAALAIPGFSPQSYLKKNSDVANYWSGSAGTTKGPFNNDPNLYGAWHYWNLGKKEGRQFFTGGYTGPGGVLEEAGIVHKGEVVFSQADVSRWGGWQAVEKLRKGPQLSIAAPSMAASGAASTNIVLIEELRQMRNELEMMRYETKATAINTGRTQDLMRRVTRNGEAMQTEAFEP